MTRQAGNHFRFSNEAHEPMASSVFPRVTQVGTDLVPKSWLPHSDSSLPAEGAY